MMLAAQVLQAALELAGVVMGPGGKPLSGAVVTVGAHAVRSDAKGRFKLPLTRGDATATFTARGMEPQVRAIVPGKPLLVLLEPEVKEAVVEVVEGAGYGTDGPGSAITRLEIYTTPGAAADVFQGVKALPGVSNASEGAELFVRGGNPSEVGIYLNGGHLQHPFHHPSTQGGIFSSVDTALVTHLNFVPGGFSARYGDALSAVMELSTETASRVRGGTLLLDLAGQGLMVDEPLAGGILRGSYRHADTTPLDKWYGLAANFTEAPISQDLHLSYQRSFGATGRLSTTVLLSRDHLGLDYRIQNLEAVYANRSDTRFLSASWTQGLGSLAVLNLAASHTRFASTWTFDRWGMDQVEGETFGRAEVVVQASPLLGLEFGADAARTSLDPRGQVPYDTSNWGPGAAPRTFGYGFEGTRTGGYLTLRFLLGDRWGLSLGGRADRYGLLGENTRDLRATLSFKAGPRLTLLAAGGTFHQMPALTQLDPHQGNPALRALRATHAVLSADARDDGAPVPWQARLELYRKDYGSLVVRDPLLHYASTGRGVARGLDLLLKARKGAFRGQLGYGYLDTRRREDDQYALGPVPTSVPHSFTTVGTWTIRPGWEWSGSWRYATGAPFTPVEGGLPDGQGGFTPLEGARYGERLPAYARVDSRLTRLFPLGSGRAVAFLEVMNLLDRHNVASYSYNPDFTVRRAHESYFSRRILVAGFSLSW
ncbi:TonB-dependent receptor [Geothrix sp. 21YS21S-2]|uniref:TonB-dependent receptor n=1 Tax=Geothrix sp. 21YS21S-2 TaxID=3068893 RepID=UPI0027B918AA|nr:TonB-dependent receptor [Geothrix sp. 21YS21S-2]